MNRQMPTRKTPILTHRFAYNHFQTDGKLENLFEALDQVKAKTVCLCLSDPAADGVVLDKQASSERLERVERVIRRFRRRGIKVDLALPGLLTGPAGGMSKTQLARLYADAAQMGPATIWVDETQIGSTGADSPKGTSAGKRITRVTLLGRAKALKAAIGKENRHVRLGLIAAGPDHYAQVGVNALQIATVLAGNDAPLLAQQQGFRIDRDRTELLRTACVIAATTTLAAESDTGAKQQPELVGFVDNAGASSFHKSAEATQMQTNVNVLYGVSRVMLDLFDHMGTAPGTENAFLQMQQNRSKLIGKLAGLVPADSAASPLGPCVVVPDHPTDALGEDAFGGGWPILLWRLGLPVTFLPTSAVGRHTGNHTAYILAGQTAAMLSKKQLQHILHQGVLLDPTAAQAITAEGHGDMMGIEVGGQVRNIQAEIFSDPTFSAAYYGYRNLLAENGVPLRCHRIQPIHSRARTFTTLQRLGGSPNIPGAAMFDDTEHNHRCAVLPHSFAGQPPTALLSTQHQNHFVNLLHWLSRAPMPCYVENAPDLIPFYFPDRSRRQAVLALLNIGFDWAIDSRVRLGHLPVPVKRVQELNEQGQVISTPSLRPHKHGIYRYIELTTDTAVPPMQMTILILKG